MCHNSKRNKNTAAHRPSIKQVKKKSSENDVHHGSTDFLKCTQSMD